MELTNPIIKKIEDNEFSLSQFEEQINACKDKNEKMIIRDYPTVYIHTWENKGIYEVYVGETNDIFRRTRQHYEDSRFAENWQYNLKLSDNSLYVIGHEHFNKSLTLDIENKLRDYLTGVDSVRRVHNIKANPQNQYYPANEFDQIFHKIWKNLTKYNNKLFPLESEVINSAIFKASPLHKLTRDQQRAKELIISKIIEASITRKSGKLIFVEGGTGTGKTVLNSSTFYELCCMNETSIEDDSKPKIKELKCCLIVNHKEQENLYRQIFKKFGIEDNTLYSPIKFINKHDINSPIDVAFIDEAHLLLTQGKQSYKGKNQLQDIMNRARVTVVMFDMSQILTVEQYWEYELLEKYKNMARENNNYIVLTEQLRIQANKDVIQWIENFTKNGIVTKLPNNLENYDIKVFDTPKLLEDMIKQKAKDKNSKLSRLVATYDWKYSSLYTNNEQYWEVTIGKWHKPWNYEMARKFNRNEKKKIKDKAWDEQEHTIDEIGSTFTIQGFDLNYVGVIIGPSVKYRNNRIVYCPEFSWNRRAVIKRRMSDGTYKEFGEQLIKNQLRVLMTRGVNGLYIYACDEELREHLKKCVEKRYIYK